jgi:hypothetical protein
MFAACLVLAAQILQYDEEHTCNQRYSQRMTCPGRIGAQMLNSLVILPQSETLAIELV